ncbi:Methylmalonyl-CoA mutase small subunit [Austwickia sp. TVS 96-490-7B]|uniref:methylmalonyl-CoA mutase small subunit n=1 Tax=Austwickia sp. TVS 96-490-7B TaxID=2830843 RepID=UPI001C58AA46|nr:methylmalonyl-CoA mutase small subunit [Austwickia sp. TVS 96-490-7B]MBW3086711.1 Methylmalonyl-CoA mutase small subunit [Austwickia sp. TVS 96-490-7B]
MTTKDDPHLPLADGFDDLTHAQWQKLVAKVLNRGRPEDRQFDGPTAEARLHTTTVEGIGIDCLYEQGEQARPIGHPGVMPFTRGSGYRPANVPWGIRALHDDPDPTRTQKAILTDLERGATSIWLEIGDHAVRPEDVAKVTDGMLLDLAPICVSSRTDQAAAASAVLDLWRQRGLTTKQARGNLGLDPLGAAARTGSAPDATAMLSTTKTCLADYPQVRAIAIDMRPYHDAGAGDVDEIACAVATGIDYLRRLEEAGIDATQAFTQIEFRVNATTDQFLTIAKMRALRRLWARVGEECDVPEKDRGARLHAVTSWRMLSRDDPYVNMLRTTIACFGAAVGAAEAITVLPFDTVIGLPDEFSRRIARNTQVLLAEESNVGRVLDPSGGSWYVETLTDELAAAAWTALQEIEGAGGMTSALADGLVAARIDAANSERAKRLAKRTLPLTGVSMFPQVDEKRLERIPRQRVDIPAGGLVPHRDAEVFEAMRDRALAHAQTTGSAPEVFLACLGARRDFGARETFTSALLAVAGLATPRSEGGTAEEIGAAAKKHGARVAVLCSSTGKYAEEGADVAAALRQAGVERLFIAGKASELGENSGCVDDAIGMGMDVVATLTSILDLLGAPTAETTATADKATKNQGARR